MDGVLIKVNGATDKSLSPAEIEVVERMGQATSFRLRFSIGISAEGDFPVLRDDRLSVGSEIAILAGVKEEVSCLVHGPVTGQKITFVHGGGGSYVDVEGADRSIEMDREDKAVQWSDLTDSSAVSSILGTYHLESDLDETKTTHSEAKHTLVQRETDLTFVRRLARRNGYLFWITSDEKGAADTAHFKRPPLEGPEALELIINDDPASFGKCEISWEAERPVAATASQHDLSEQQTIDGKVDKSPLAPLAKKELAGIAKGKQTLHLIAAVDDAADLKARTEAALIEAGFFVTATGSTTTTALGKIVRAHSVVKLSGVGKRHSGKYFCSGVRHFITGDTHRMDVELMRNSWGD